MASKRASLSIDKNNILLNLLSEDFSVDDIGKHVGASRSCVYKFLKRYRERKTTENLPQPKKTTVRDDRHLIRTVLSNR